MSQPNLAAGWPICSRWVAPRCVEAFNVCLFSSLLVHVHGNHYGNNRQVQDLLVAKHLALPPTGPVLVLKRLSRYEAIILDDLGYVQQSQEEMEVLFTLLAYRYERGSLMITSNLPFSQWEAIFKNPMTTAAAIDRLVHHSVILELNLPSYRLEASKRQASRPGSAPPRRSAR